MDEYKQFDIVYADLSGKGTVGSEQKGIRPVVIIQNDTGNAYSSTLLVMALTKELKYDKEKLLEEYNRLKEEDFNQKQEIRYQKYIEENNKYLEDEQFWEFQTLQVFINDNPFDAAYTFLVPFEDVENGDKCTLVGIIAKVQKKKDKNGKQFAYINIYSSFGLVEGIVWHSTLKEFEDLVKKGQQVAILCKKDSEERVIVEKIKPYSEWIKYVRKKGAKV